jgi:hypothetical protein
MGFTPAEIDAMSLWEFNACATGYSEAHGGKKQVSPMSDEDLKMLGIEGA